MTAGYIGPEARVEFYQGMDAANVDLKGFTEDFYHRICGGHLAPVLETLEYLRNHTKVWFEITTLLIPGANDSDEEIRKLSQWVGDKLGPETPIHFTAFHPDYKMTDRANTPATTLSRARFLAREIGLAYVYTGNVHDGEGGSTWCPQCGALLIERDWYSLGRWGLDDKGRCGKCRHQIPGLFEARPGDWGPRRQLVRLQSAAP